MNKRYIHITKADRDFIAKALNVTEKTVYNAIRFDDRRGNSVTFLQRSVSWPWIVAVL